MSVLTANGEKLTVPLAWVDITSPRGCQRELVGIMDSLPVDILLGRSSYGQTLTKEDVLAQWEDATMSDVIDNAFVLTRQQSKLQRAQARREEQIDRESTAAVKHLTPPPSKGAVSQLDEVSITNDVNEVSDQSESQEQSREDIFRVQRHLLDRNRDQLVEDQKNDCTLGDIYDSAHVTPSQSVDCYFVDNNGVLMHRKYTNNEHNGLNYTDRIVIPELYRQEILRLGHATPLAGHMGREKTHSRISTHFYWPKLHFDVKKYCATCPDCQLVSRKLVASREPLRPVPIVSEPFRKIAIDIIGELPRSKSGCKYILTIVDYATRYPEAIPLKNISAKSVSDALIECFSRVGIPQELVSDQGSNFVSKLMKQLYEQLGITKIQTSVYHPEANGLVERFNGTLKTMLRKFVNESVHDWDKLLPYVLFAYREVPCESTGYSPFELLYGRTPRGPLTVIKENWLDEASEENLVSYVVELRRRLASMQRNVAEKLTECQAKQKHLYDRKCTSRRFQVGDKVLVLLPTPGSKLETKWQGPFVVTQVKDDGRSYVVNTKSHKKRYRTYYVNLLKKWQSRNEIAALAIPESVAENFPVQRTLLQLNKYESWKDVRINDQLSEEQRTLIEETLEDFSDVFDGVPGRTTAATHSIDTGDANPIRSTPYKVPKSLEDQVSAEIDKMSSMGVIRPSKSPWASPVVIVPKLHTTD